MRHSLAFALAAVLTAAFPAGARAHDEPRWNWDDEEVSQAAPPPEPGAYDQAPPDGGGVDVQVGISTPGAAVTFDTFQGGLAPYGDWVTVNNYGRVWRPSNMPAGWRPYYYGRWEWTDEGWLWVSDEPFGWATYHYGRWAYDAYQGWVWVPGYQWAPAWVTWRYSPDYVGWAPLAPGFSVYVSSFPVGYSWWTFVPCNAFVGFPVYRHAYAPHYVPRIWDVTRPAPPRAAIYGHAAPAWGGPARVVVEGRVGRPIVPVRVHPVGSPAAAAAPGRGGVFPVFRPEAARPLPAPGARPGFSGSAAPRPAPQVERGGFGGRPTPAPGSLPGWRGDPRQGRPGASPQAPQPVYRPQAPQGGRPQYLAPSSPGRSYAPPSQGRPQYAPAPSQGRPQAAPPQGGRAPAAPSGGGHGGQAGQAGQGHGGGRPHPSR